PPTNTEAARGQQQAAAENLIKSISENNLKGYQETAKELLDDHDSVSVVAAALSLLTKERKDTPIRISSVQPISVRGGGGKGGGGNRRSGSGGGKRFYGKGKGGSNRQGQGGRGRNNRSGSRNEGRGRGVKY